jgi:hypothetical protein
MFYVLDHCLFVFILFNCFSHNLGFSFIQLASYGFFLILLHLQHHNQTSYSSLVSSNFCNETLPQLAMLAALDLTTISVDGSIGSVLYDISIGYLSF